ncbi:hypothetical protein MMIC_P0453 [Mariprofundus micogutta]|uniref:POTRA domain-containing protein n=1 Tax=Mariprofundus micogutta TaxID=1921010 RepID=A0A1L8CKZ0_9PROT|nr:hypothetical protein [Mariprofundus micogutta]GAV19519.1 hypothetical protein MMIC_P0453 [Mariprofundus micogutta]
MLSKLWNLCLSGLLCLCMPFSASAERAVLPWVDTGWSQLQSGEINQALSTWQQGLNNLPDKQLLGSLGTFSNLDYAIARIKRAGVDENVFMISYSGSSSQMYYVLTAQSIARNMDIRQTEMAVLKERVGMHGKLLANEAQKFKTGKTTNKALHARMPTSKKSTAKQQAILAVEESTFTINSFEVKGNKRVSTDTILLSLRDYYGSEKTPSEFNSIRRQIIDIYNMQRVYNVKVNRPQFIEDDTVLISITEL